MSVTPLVEKPSEAAVSSKALNKQTLRRRYREVRDGIDQTIDLIPAHQYLQTVTFGDSPLTVQEAGHHGRQLDPRYVKGTTRVLEEVLSKRKAEQDKASGAKKNAKKKKASNRGERNVEVLAVQTSESPRFVTYPRVKIYYPV